MKGKVVRETRYELTVTPAELEDIFHGLRAYSERLRNLTPSVDRAEVDALRDQVELLLGK